MQSVHNKDRSKGRGLLNISCILFLACVFASWHFLYLAFKVNQVNEVFSPLDASFTPEATATILLMDKGENQHSKVQSGMSSSDMTASNPEDVKLDVVEYSSVVENSNAVGMFNTSIVTINPPLCAINDYQACEARFSYSKHEGINLSKYNEYDEEGIGICIPWPPDLVRERSRTTQANSENIRIAFYAERNTGSNLLQKYYRQQLIGFRSFRNWKHGCTPPLSLIGGSTDDTHLVVISKSPFSWLASLYERHYNESPNYERIYRKLSFSAFLRTKFCSRIGNDHTNSDNMEHCMKLRNQTSSYNLHQVNTSQAHFQFNYESEKNNIACNIDDDKTFWSPIEMYNLKLRSYVSATTRVDHQHFIRYEELLTDPVGTLSWLMSRISFIHPREHCFKVMERNAKGVNNVRTRSYFLQRYFYNRTWEDYYNSVEDINYVNNRLDKEVLKAWKYNLLSTSVAFKKKSSHPIKVKRDDSRVDKCWRCWGTNDRSKGEHHDHRLDKLFSKDLEKDILKRTSGEAAKNLVRKQKDVKTKGETPRNTIALSYLKQVNGKALSSPLCDANANSQQCHARFSHSREVVIPYSVYEGKVSEGYCFPWNGQEVYGKQANNTIDIALKKVVHIYQRIAFYGERNTGTSLFMEYVRYEVHGFKPIGRHARISPYRERERERYPRRFLFAVFCNLYSAGGWKHSCGVPMHLFGGHAGTHVVAMAKSPYSWLTSLYHQPYQTSQHYLRRLQSMSFSDFIRTKFCPRFKPESKSEQFDYCDNIRKKLRKVSSQSHRYESEEIDQECQVSESTFWSPIEMYNLKLRSYTHVNENPDYQHFIRYEDLLLDPLGTLKWLMLRINGDVFPKSDCLLLKESNTKLMIGASAKKNRNYFLHKYFYNRTWESLYRSVEDINYVNNRLDKEVLKAWKYDLLSVEVASKYSTTNAGSRNNQSITTALNPCFRCYDPPKIPTVSSHSDNDQESRGMAKNSLKDVHQEASSLVRLTKSSPLFTLNGGNIRETSMDGVTSTTTNTSKSLPSSLIPRSPEQVIQNKQFPSLCACQDVVRCSARFSYTKPSTQLSSHMVRWNEEQCTPWPKKDILPAVVRNQNTTLDLWAKQDDKANKIAFYGERNTGTNLFLTYAREDIAKFIMLGNWKHGCGAPAQYINGFQFTTHVVAISKSPYSWLTSLFRRPYNDSPRYSQEHQKMTFSQFLRSKICTRVGMDHTNSDNYEHCARLRYQGANNYLYMYESERVDEACGIKEEEMFWSPIEMYNLKLRSYTHVNENPDYQHFVRYEDLLLDPMGTLNWLMIRIGYVHPKSKCFQPLSVDPKGGKTEDRSYFLQRYFYNRTWESLYRSVEDINYVNNRLDKEVLKAWKYDLLSVEVASKYARNTSDFSIDERDFKIIEKEKEATRDLAPACFKCWKPKAERDKERRKEQERRDALIKKREANRLKRLEERKFEKQERKKAEERIQGI